MNGNADRRTGSVAVEMAANGVNDDTVKTCLEQERKLEAQRLKIEQYKSLVEILTQNLDKILSLLEKMLGGR